MDRVKKMKSQWKRVISERQRNSSSVPSGIPDLGTNFRKDRFWETFFPAQLPVTFKLNRVTGSFNGPSIRSQRYWGGDFVFSPSQGIFLLSETNDAITYGATNPTILRFPKRGYHLVLTEKKGDEKTSFHERLRPPNGTWAFTTRWLRKFLRSKSH